MYVCIQNSVPKTGALWRRILIEAKTAEVNGGLF